MAVSPLLAPAQAHIFTQSERQRHLVETLLTYKLSPQSGHAPLRELRLVGIQKFRCHKSQYGVAEKFKALIALTSVGTALIGVGAVGEGCLQKLTFFETVSDFCFKVFHVTPFSASYTQYFP